MYFVLIFHYIGGRDEDTANLVTFMQELKEACGNTYGISATLPSSYCTF